MHITYVHCFSLGVQLVRDPIMLLLDEPTHGLDPLSAYLLISILSNTAKKTGCGILLSLEKPRSDVFPFLDRALFLCLGGVVYSGGTRAMLEYFHGIGFPCPQLENPLMYYLCLSTVDRRWVSSSSRQLSIGTVVNMYAFWMLQESRSLSGIQSTDRSARTTFFAWKPAARHSVESDGLGKGAAVLWKTRRA